MGRFCWSTYLWLELIGFLAFLEHPSLIGVHGFSSLVDCANSSARCLSLLPNTERNSPVILKLEDIFCVISTPGQGRWSALQCVGEEGEAAAKRFLLVKWLPAITQVSKGALMSWPGVTWAAGEHDQKWLPVSFENIKWLSSPVVSVPIAHT